MRPRGPGPVCPSGEGGSCKAGPGLGRGVQPGTRPPHLRSQQQRQQQQLAVLAGPEAPPPGPIEPQRTPEIARSAGPSPELVVLGRAKPASSGHLPGLRATQRGPGYRAPPPPLGPWGRDPTSAPLTRRGRKKAARASHPAAPSRLSLPGQRRRPETPPPPTSGRNPEIHSSCLASPPTLPPPSPGNSIPAARPAGGGPGLGGRTTYGLRNPSLQAVATRTPEAVPHLRLPCARPGPRLGQYPQATWRQRQHLRRLSAPPCYWPGPGVRTPLIGRERCGGWGWSYSRRALGVGNAV